MDTPDSQRSGPQRPPLLVLTSTLPARPDDGTPAFVLTLSQALARSHDVTILAPRVPGAAKDETIAGTRIHRFPYFFQRWEGLADGAIMPNLRAQPWRVIEAPALIIGFVLAALRETRRRRPIAVSAHWIVPAGLVALVLRGLRKIPFVLTVHGADAYALRGRIAGFVKRRVIARAAVVTPVSIDIARRLGLSEDDVVAMGTDASEVEQNVTPREPREGRVLFVGRLAEKKGVDVLLRAMSTVEGADLVVIGDGPERTRLEELAATEAVAERTEFLGQQPRERVLDELRSARVMAIPSKVASDGDQDGTPVVMVEAMAAGVPIVASALGGLAEHIQDPGTGWLVTPDDPDGLAEALREALTSDDAARRAEEARRYFAEHLELSTVATRYEAFIERAATNA